MPKRWTRFHDPSRGCARGLVTRYTAGQDIVPRPLSAKFPRRPSGASKAGTPLKNRISQRGRRGVYFGHRAMAWKSRRNRNVGLLRREQTESFFARGCRTTVDCNGQDEWLTDSTRVDKLDRGMQPAPLSKFSPRPSSCALYSFLRRSPSPGYVREQLNMRLPRSFT